jgi:hypothetical protein
MLSALLGQPKEGFLMSTFIGFEPWITSSDECDAVPPDAKLVFRHAVVDRSRELEEDVLFHARMKGWLDFWLRTEDQSGAVQSFRICRVRDPGDLREEALRLIEALFRARAGFVGNRGVIDAGLISSDEYDAIGQEILREIKAQAKEIQSGRVGSIVALARKLRLDPKPSGANAYNWSAWCPGTTHRLALSTYSQRFVCRVCGEWGDVGELTGLLLMKSAPRLRQTIFH